LNVSGAVALRFLSSKAGASFSTFLQTLEDQSLVHARVLTQFETHACVLTRTGSM
jgi:hypothetical protein